MNNSEIARMFGMVPRIGAATIYEYACPCGAVGVYNSELDKARCFKCGAEGNIKSITGPSMPFSVNMDYANRGASKKETAKKPAKTVKKPVKTAGKK